MYEHSKVLFTQNKDEISSIVFIDEDDKIEYTSPDGHIMSDVCMKTWWEKIMMLFKIIGWFVLIFFGSMALLAVRDAIKDNIENNPVKNISPEERAKANIFREQERRMREIRNDLIQNTILKPILNTVDDEMFLNACKTCKMYKYLYFYRPQDKIYRNNKYYEYVNIYFTNRTDKIYPFYVIDEPWDVSYHTTPEGLQARDSCVGLIVESDDFNYSNETIRLIIKEVQNYYVIKFGLNRVAICNEYKGVEIYQNPGYRPYI